MAERKALVLNPLTGELQQHKGTDTIFGLLPGEAAAKAADLTAEIARAIAAEDALDARLDTAESNITALQASATALDARLTTAEGEIDTLQTGLANEITARTNADTALQNAIDAE
ncbi:hypothetical protein RZS08_59425, partial [Arthrospira platensis SPKY1]|nr:hypothetical protein [Arthrospira platensis SPKY1]